MTLNVYRGSSVIAHFTVDERTLFVQKFLGENYIHAETTVRSPLDITIGDYVRYNDIRYHVNTIPDATKNATNQYVYTLTFESEYYDFAKVQYRSDGQGDFYLMGNLDLFLDLLITNMNRVYGAGVWSKGTCTQTNAEYKLLKFEAQNCREVIQTLCTEFNGEFSFAQKVISFSDERTNDTGLTFQYKAGLRNIQRQPINSGNIITRLYAYGSTRNLGSSYGKLRLELKTVAPLPTNLDYIESNVATYGTIEGAVIFDDVFPRYEGHVDTAPTIKTFTQSDFPFNVNTYLIADVTANVNFKTGNCAGYTFGITAYNDTAPKTFTIIPVILEDGTEMPNVTLHPEAGDTFVLIDITLPASYILAAEAELQALAINYLTKYDHPRVAYALTPDWRYLKARAVNLTIGDTVTIEDADLGVNVKVRITELSQQLIEPYKYTLSLTDQVESMVPGQTQLLLDTYNTGNVSAGKIAAAPVVRDIGRSRLNWRTTEELRTMVFDPDDGYFDPTNIKPLSIQTTMLAAGSKSGNFELNGVVIKPNYLGNNTRLSITGGTLTHMAINNAGADSIGTWTLVANTSHEALNSLPVATAYYLYAKCSKTNYTDGANQIILSSTAYQADQGTYWYFLVGVLHSTTGVVPRGLSLSYGQTLINGGHITTGKIESANGLTYFDLDNNVIVLASGAATIAGTAITSIENGATAGATWGTNLTNIPATLGTPSGAGLYLGATNLGYWNGATWKTYMDNTGNFYLGGSGGPMTYDATTGKVTLANATSGQRIVIDAAGKLTFYNSGGTQQVLVDDNVAYKVQIGDPAGTSLIKMYGGYLSIVSATQAPVLMLQQGALTAQNIVEFWGYRPGASEQLGQIDNAGNLTLYPPVTAGGGLSLKGNITMAANSTVDGVDISLHAGAGGAVHANAISEGAAGFMTGAQVKKLADIETLADVTDATNVAAAGALMDGDFTSNGLMKRTGAGTYGIVAAQGIPVNLIYGPIGSQDGYYLRWSDTAGAYWSAT